MSQAEQILRKGARDNMARDIAIYLTGDSSVESGVDLGIYFGNISGDSITGRYNHTSEHIRGNRRLKGRFNRI